MFEYVKSSRHKSPNCAASQVKIIALTGRGPDANTLILIGWGSKGWWGAWHSIWFLVFWHFAAPGLHSRRGPALYLRCPARWWFQSLHAQLHENRNQSIGSRDVLLVQLCANRVSEILNAAGFYFRWGPLTDHQHVHRKNYITLINHNKKLFYYNQIPDYV